MKMVKKWNEARGKVNEIAFQKFCDQKRQNEIAKSKQTLVMKFRKKPVEIEAIQYNNLNREEIEKFVGKKLTQELWSETAYLAGMGAPSFSISIETKEGVMKALPGDWIIKEPFPTGDRDFYPCKPDIFKNTYDPIL